MLTVAVHTCMVVILFAFYLCTAMASQGDRSPFYMNCIENCMNTNCTVERRQFKKELASSQPLANRLLLWGCDEECRYSCMWRTVRAFDDRGWPPVKFHGKWPFMRILGVQELGSVVGSMLNLVAHLFMYNKMSAAFSRRNTPLLWLWTVFSAVCINGWMWSIIFHMRDTPFTEFMDYACALSMVTILFITSVVRIMYGKSQIVTSLVIAITLLYYMEHVRYLYAGSLDYQYNMVVNILPGALSVILWTAWGLWRLRYFPYTWRILLFNVLATMFLSLELLDFPPYLYLWDAHALWHFSTSILPLIFYRFVYDDLVYLRQSWPDIFTTEKSDTKIC